MSFIRSAISDRILVVTFDDPTSRNSFSSKAAEELDRCLSANAGTFDALVFESAGRVFCSGGNLSDYAAMTKADEGKAVNRRITEVLDRVSRIETPTVCSVGGDCFGGGVELISAFDHVLAVSHAFFGLWQRKIGLSFGWGGGARLERRLGSGALRRLALSAETFDARSALSAGLVDEVVTAEILRSRALARARALMALPKAPIASLKSWEANRELEVFESLWLNEEHQKALAARKK